MCVKNDNIDYIVFCHLRLAMELWSDVKPQRDVTLFDLNASFGFNYLTLKYMKTSYSWRIIGSSAELRIIYRKTIEWWEHFFIQRFVYRICRYIRVSSFRKWENLAIQHTNVSLRQTKAVYLLRRFCCM